MCALTGILAGSGPHHSDLASIAIARRMVEALYHRGPDDGEVWTEEGIALDHWRLSILDLSLAGAQPMVSPSRQFVIAYNGEIYNHFELRRELENAGAVSVWRGDSDTETLLVSIEHWGLEETLT